MAITESNRHQMYDKLREVLGDEDASTLMEHLPPVGWADVATRRDLDHHAAVTRTDLRREMAVLRGDLSREMAVLRGDLRREIAEVRTDLSHEIADLRTDLSHEIADLRTDLSHEIADVRTELVALEGKLSATEAGLTALVHRELASLTRTFIIAMVGAMVTIAGLAFAAAHIT